MTVNKADLIAVRDGEEADRNFILATWLRGLYYGNDWYGTIEKSAYFKAYHNIISKLLEHPSAKVKVACLKEDPSVILGYSVLRDGVLDWVHVKSAWRKIGIAKMLVPAETKVVTHLTKVGKTLLFNNNLIFNPFV